VLLGQQFGYEGTLRQKTATSSNDTASNCVMLRPLGEGEAPWMSVTDPKATCQ